MIREAKTENGWVRGIEAVKDRKHKPEVVDGDIECVNDEEVSEEESENK